MIQHCGWFLLCICGLATKLCPTLCDPMDCSPPASSIHRISQERILEWLPFPSLMDLPDPGIKPALPTISYIAEGFCTKWVTREAHSSYIYIYKFIYLFLSVLGLHCCMGFSLVAMSRGYSLVAVHQLHHCSGFPCCGALALGTWVSVVATSGLSSHGSQALEHRLNGCGTQA